MKLAIFADLHLGNHKRSGGPSERSLNRRCREGLDVLRRAYQLAATEKCRIIVSAGDLTDTSKPPPQLVGEAMQIVHESAVDLDMPSILLVGNHEQESDQPGDHALAPFLTYPDEVTVVESTCTTLLDEGLELVMVPHSAAAPASERLEEALRGLAPPVPGRARVLVMHVGIADDDTPPFLRGAADAVHVKWLGDLAAEAGVHAVLAGNWHKHKTWQPNGIPVVQIGAICPTGFDNPGLLPYGGLAILETSGTSISVRTHHLEGPRFVDVVGMDALGVSLLTPPPAHRRVYLRATVEAADVKSATEAIARAHARGWVAAGEVSAASEERVKAAMKAASAARSADTLTSALEGFVSAMNLEDGVERQDVMEKCRGYLGMRG